MLLGIPFYGHEYRFLGRRLTAAEAVTSSRLIEVLTQRADPAAAGPAAADGTPTAAAGWHQQQEQQGSCSAEGSERDTAAGNGACAAAGGGSWRSGEGGKRRGGKDGLSIAWLDEAAEHLFQWKEPAPAAEGGSGKKSKKKTAHRLYFPTPRAVAARLAVAADRRMGVSVWELGQGLQEMAALL